MFARQFCFQFVIDASIPVRHHGSRISDKSVPINQYPTRNHCKNHLSLPIRLMDASWSAPGSVHAIWVCHRSHVSCSTGRCHGRDRIHLHRSIILPPSFLSLFFGIFVVFFPFRHGRNGRYVVRIPNIGFRVIASLIVATGLSRRFSQIDMRSSACDEDSQLGFIFQVAIV